MIKVCSKAVLCLSLVFFAGLRGLAQELPDENPLPDPLAGLQSSFYPAVKKPVRSFVYIIEKDTILKSAYDKNGNELSKFDYESNKPLYKSVYTYKENLRTETAFFVNNTLQTTTSYTYNSNKQLAGWKKVNIVYDKKTQQSTRVTDIQWVCEWNEKNKLKRKYSIDLAGTQMLSFDYTYDAAGKLTETDEKQWKNKYEYQNGLLTSQSRIFKNDNSVYASAEYKYNESGLLSWSSDKYYTSEYSYDAGRLKKIRYTKKADNTWQEIDFYYSGTTLSKVEITTTDASSKPQFIFKLDYLYSSWSKSEPNKLRMEFVYDQHNNIKEIKYFIKDTYKYSKLFVYSYF